MQIKGWVILIIILLSSAYPSSAQHSFDAKGQTSGSSANPVTLSFTTTSGTTVLVVGLAMRSVSARAGGAPTFNGVALTQANTTKVAASEVSAELWYLLDPPIGTYTISVPNSGGLTMTLMASSYKAASGKTSALDVAGGWVGNTVNPSNNLITTTYGDAVVDIMAHGLNTAETGRNQVLLYATDQGQWNTAGQYALQTTAGSITFSHTIAADNWAHLMVSFKEQSQVYNYQRNLSQSISVSHNIKITKTTAPINYSRNLTQPIIVSHYLDVTKIRNFINYSINISQPITVGHAIQVTKTISANLIMVNISQPITLSHAIDVLKTTAPINYPKNLSQQISAVLTISISKTTAPVNYSKNLSQPIGVSHSISVIKTLAPTTYIQSLTQQLSISQSVSVFKIISNGIALSGYIYNVLGAPIHNVRVETQDNFSFTNTEGYYTFQTKYPDNVSSRAVGYRNNITIQNTSGDTQLNITLKERTPATVTAPAPSVILNLFILAILIYYFKKNG